MKTKLSTVNNNLIKNSVHTIGSGYGNQPCVGWQYVR